MPSPAPSPAHPDALIDEMRQVGFHTVVAQLYRHLLQHGPNNKEQLRGGFSSTRSQLKKSLQTLRRFRLIGTDHNRGDLLYYATDPNLAWLALNARIAWRHDTSLRPVEDIPALATADAEAIRQRFVAVRQIASHLYRPYKAVDRHHYIEAATDVAYAQLLWEVISEAEHAIFAISKTPRDRNVDRFWVTLVDRLRAGVSYRRIADFKELVDHGLDVIDRDILEYGVDLRILEHGRIGHRFYVVDRTYLSVRRETNDKHSHFGRITNSRPIVARYRKRHGQYWKQAVPAQELVPHLRQESTVLLEQASQLSDSAHALLSEIVRLGKFSPLLREARQGSTAWRDTLASLQRADLLTIDHTQVVIPRYTISDRSLRA